MATAYLDVAFVGYSYPFRNSPFRLSIFPHLKRRPRREVLSWVNQNIRILTRIVVLKAYRRQGYGRRLITESLPLLNVPYVECITADVAIGRLLATAAFVCEGKIDSPPLYYYLWRRILMAAAAI
jgi:GNAT superfamily N-acetyltransferase